MRKRPLFILIAITFLALGFAHALFWVGQQGLFWDAAGYYDLGVRIAKTGLFNFADETRTFGYPLFIAILWLLSDHSAANAQFLIFDAQLCIYLGVCFFAFAVFRRVFQKTALAICLFAVLTLNPFLLIFTGEVLSDLLSAILLFLSLLIAIRASGHGARDYRGSAFLSCFAAGCATMVRPANLTIAAAVVAIWYLRRLIFKEGTLQTWLLMMLGFCIPFIPQLINNYRAYAQFQPLIVRSLYSEQLNWGIKYLKGVSIVLPEYGGSLVFVNPFLSPQISSPAEFLIKQPIEFGLTQAVHLFALFDYDYAFPYIRNLDAWYRLPLTVANYLFLFGVIGGILAWLPRVRHPMSFNRLDLALAGMLLGALVYLPGYLLVAVEPRFSLPLYLLLSPFFVYGLWRTQMLWTQKRWRTIALQIVGLIIFVGANLLVYHWFHTRLISVSPLYLPSNIASALGQYTLTDVQIRFTDQIILRGAGFDQTRQAQGGDLIYITLKWLCAGASTESYDLQINLVDSKDRIWAKGIRDTPGKVPPCANWSRGATEDPSVVAFHLPVTMPAGEYAVTLSLFDQKRGQYIVASTAAGEPLGDHPRVARLPIAKNKSSITADQLYIENRYFVDMQEMRLLGYAELPDRFQPGDEIDLGLYWRARSRPRGDYVVVVQLRDSLGTVAIEQSARPAEGTDPTTAWNEGEVLLDWHSVTLPIDLPTGEYQIVVLLRNTAQGQPLGEASISKILITR